MMHIVYRTERCDGAYYIGVHSTTNTDDGYLGSGTRLLASIKKHGRSAHTRRIIQTFTTREEADVLEETLVTRETLKDPLCLNLTTGGKHSAQQHTMKTREKMSASARGKPKSEEHRRKIAEALRGKQRSVDHSRKLSEAAKRRVADPTWINPWSGESGATIAARNNQARKGKPLSEEHKMKLSLAIKGRKAAQKDHMCSSVRYLPHLTQT